jgi:hypothetical protein
MEKIIIDDRLKRPMGYNISNESKLLHEHLLLCNDIIIKCFSDVTKNAMNLNNEQQNLLKYELNQIYMDLQLTLQFDLDHLKRELLNKQERFGEEVYRFTCQDCKSVSIGGFDRGDQLYCTDCFGKYCKCGIKIKDTHVFIDFKSYGWREFKAKVICDQNCSYYSKKDGVITCIKK